MKVAAKECIKFTKEEPVQVVSVRQLFKKVWNDDLLNEILSAKCYNIVMTRNWINYNSSINAWKNRSTGHWEVDLNSVIAYCESVVKERQIDEMVNAMPAIVAMRKAEHTLLEQYNMVGAERDNLFAQLKNEQMENAGL